MTKVELTIHTRNNILMFTCEWCRCNAPSGVRVFGENRGGTEGHTALVN